MMRSVILFLLFALIGLQYKLWIGDSSVVQWQRLAHKIDLQTAVNEKLLVRNQAIEADINELKRGEQALEEQARYELGMIKEGEIYYQFVD